MSGNRPLRIGIVAGEASGDIIAADLMRALLQRHPDTRFEGVAGPRMLEAGCNSLYPVERLSVMGLAEVLLHLPGLFAMRRRLARHFRIQRPDVFIGVDAPDFNLGLEARLHSAGIRTLHYVSPSVWAWRRYRVHKIARSVDCMLTLFPFEARFYREQQVPARFVGHPLADMIADEADREMARRRLALDHDGPVLAMLPGSRAGEVARMSTVFLETAHWCCRRRDGLRFLVPLANAACRAAFEQAACAFPDLPVTKVDGRSAEVMAAADAVLLASGTATLECMLLKRPMVVAYRLAPATYHIARHLVHTRYFSLPNLLADRPLVREYLQHEVRPDTLGAELLALLDDDERVRDMTREFGRLHHVLRRGASEQAADAVLELAGAH